MRKHELHSPRQRWRKCQEARPSRRPSDSTLGTLKIVDSMSELVCAVRDVGSLPRQKPPLKCSSVSPRILKTDADSVTAPRTPKAGRDERAGLEGDSARERTAVLRDGRVASTYARAVRRHPSCRSATGALSRRSRWPVRDVSWRSICCAARFRNSSSAMMRRRSSDGRIWSRGTGIFVESVTGSPLTIYTVSTALLGPTSTPRLSLRAGIGCGRYYLGSSGCPGASATPRSPANTPREKTAPSLKNGTLTSTLNRLTPMA